MYLWLCLNAVVLNPVLLARFDHCSRRFFLLTDDLCSAVITVVVVTPLRPLSLLQRVRGELLVLLGSFV